MTHQASIETSPGPTDGALSPQQAAGVTVQAITGPSATKAPGEARGSLAAATSQQPPTKLLNRNFLLQWQGQTVSRLGTQAFSVAMLFWIKHATGSAALMGILTMVAALPAVFLTPVGGAVADRYSRRNIIAISDLLRGLAILALTGLLFAVPENTTLILAGLFLVSVLNAIIGSVFNPAIAASIPDLVPKDRVVAANSLGQLSIQIAVFLGQALGGILYRVLGPLIMFFFNALSFLYASFSESFVVIPQEIPDKEANWRLLFKQFASDLKEGMRYAWRRPGLRETVLVSAVLGFFVSPIVLLLPFYVEDVLQVRIDWYGFILAAFGVGTLAGYIFAGAVRLPARVRARLIILLMFVNALGYVLLGLVRNPWAAVGLAVIGGMASGYITVNLTTLVQTTTPGYIRGRVMGLLAALAGSLAPIGMGLAGIVADLLDQNIPLIYIGCGAILLTWVAITSLIKPFRNFLSSEFDMEAQGLPQGVPESDLSITP